jgi:hypothetical protein
MRCPLRIEYVASDLGKGCLIVEVTPLAAYSEAAIIAAGWYLLEKETEIRRIQIIVREIKSTRFRASPGVPVSARRGNREPSPR